MSKNTARRIITAGVLMACAISVTGCSGSRQQEEYKRAGIEAMDEKDYSKALKSFNKALSTSVTVGAEERDIALYKASAQHELGKDGEALSTLQGLLSFDSDDYKARFLMGCIYTDCNKPGKALDSFEKACSIGGKASLYENAYQTLISGEMEDQAEKFYDQMPKEARASKKVLKLRVISFEENADFTEALDCAKSYLEQFPDDEEMTKERDFLKLATGSSTDSGDNK